MNQRDTAIEALENTISLFQSMPRRENYEQIDEQQAECIRALAALRSEVHEEKWISVKDRLPELHRMVALVHVDKWWATGRDEGVNCYDAGYLNEFGEKFWSIRGERASMIDAYSHRMPLPQPPKP
jgi:hypothetical protein